MPYSCSLEADLVLDPRGVRGICRGLLALVGAGEGLGRCFSQE